MALTEVGMKRSHPSARAILAILLLAAAAQAKDLELSLSLGSGYPVKPNLYLNGGDAAGTSTFIQTRFSGPWLLGGAHVNVEVYKAQSWRYWVGVGYEGGLGAPGYYKFGQATTGGVSSSTEIVDGSAKYSRTQFGLGTTRTTASLGEYGIYLWRRVNRIQLQGPLDTFQVQGTALTAQTSPLSSRSTRDDFMLELAMAFTQARPTFKTFERISLGTAFGPSFGAVAAGNWQLDDAYNDRLRPTLELHFSFGVRL